MPGTHGWASVSEARKKEIIAGIVSGKATAGPVHAEIDLTDRCNVACYFCNQQDVRTREQLSLGHLVSLIDQLVAGGLRSVRLSGGGDPLFHREIRPVIDHLTMRRVVIDNLTTNAVELTPAVADRLIANGCREIVVSLNAADRDDYQRMMQVKPDRFDIVLENVRALLTRRADGEHPFVVLQFLLDRHNFERMPSMYDLGAALGVDRIAIGLVTAIARERIDDNDLLTPEDGELLRHHFEKILIADRERKLLSITLPFNNINVMLGEIRAAVDWNGDDAFPTAASFQEKNGHCFFGWYSMTVRGNGDLYPCCLLLNPDYKPLGNIVTEPGVQRHWQGEKFTRLRSEMRDVIMTDAKVTYTPERFQTLQRHCVEPGLCFLKNGYFRADEEFYKELGAALDLARPKEVRILGSSDQRRRMKLVLEYHYRHFNDRTRPWRRWMKKRFGLPLTRS